MARRASAPAAIRDYPSLAGGADAILHQIGRFVHVTSSSAAVGCTAMVRSKSSLLQPGLQRDAEDLRHLAGVRPEDMGAEHPPRRGVDHQRSASSPAGRTACASAAGTRRCRFPGWRNVSLPRLPQAQPCRSGLREDGGGDAVVIGLGRIVLERRLDEAHRSWIATGVSCTRSVTSPIAQMFSTLVREKASTSTSPLAPVSTPATSSPRSSVLGMRPMASMISSAKRTSPLLSVAASMPSSRFSTRSKMVWQRMRIPFAVISSCSRLRKSMSKRCNISLPR